jgi:hypothetical protein
VNLGLPPGWRMPCGWRCGVRLTASRMRAHFTTCPKGPQAAPTQTPTIPTIEGGVRKLNAPARAADEMRLGLRRTAYGEPNARALDDMPETAGRLQARGRRGRRVKCGRHPGGEYYMTDAAAPGPASWGLFLPDSSSPRTTSGPCLPNPSFVRVARESLRAPTDAAEASVNAGRLNMQNVFGPIPVP